ncbi:hypothetical protein CP336_17165 [Pseudomonas fluorescens]|nr:hypothetical protein CP336_17165 [Pseudomonas fluorescens]
MSGLRASIRLFGLVRNLGSSDNPHRPPVDILCTINPLGGKAIRAFVSCLDVAGGKSARQLLAELILSFFESNK